ncbi:uncharacterized protein LOC126905660 isoform X2 [Daktulosphaira vitifoliae]|uniref:uncharacterized protein LOC126905660 isoform X2 n=1 Tax=Daktulosphaira vitifoliae TaxID=58002 RepID=UPI0021A9DD0F|nr:uncharacterized protein LOC126905660 isoform X2 [Daktulosphaira vitifoliae]
MYDLYKILSDIICGDRQFNIKLQKEICLSIKSNDYIKKIFSNEESLHNYLKFFVRFENRVDPVNGNVVEECPICFKESYIPMVLNNCRHSFCYYCVENLLLDEKNICPLCRETFNYYLDKDKGPHLRGNSVLIPIIIFFKTIGIIVGRPRTAVKHYFRAVYDVFTIHINTL